MSLLYVLLRLSLRGDAQTHEHFRGQFCSSNKFQIYPNIVTHSE